MVRRSALAAFVLAAALPLAAPAGQPSTAERPSEAWAVIRADLYGEREIPQAPEAIAIGAPVRAHDAAVVPVEIAVTPPEGRRVAGLTLVIDENPVPVAAVFTFGPAASPAVELSTRVRVNAYSNVRVIAELDDGTLMQSARFVKASGGCSAPAVKDPEAAAAAVGRMKLRTLGETGEVQVMIRHPNNSGFQMNQVTQLYIPAWFVDEIAVTDGGELVFRATGGISLSEDPSIRFRHTPSGEGMTVRATDTDGGIYERRFDAGAI